MHKLSTKSSTDSEIVEVSDCLPNVINLHAFMEEQGCPFEENIICQDDQSAMTLKDHRKKIHAANEQGM